MQLAKHGALFLFWWLSSSFFFHPPTTLMMCYSVCLCVCLCPSSASLAKHRQQLASLPLSFLFLFLLFSVVAIVVVSCVASSGRVSLAVCECFLLLSGLLSLLSRLPTAKIALVCCLPLLSLSVFYRFLNLTSSNCFALGLAVLTRCRNVGYLCHLSLVVPRY